MENAKDKAPTGPPHPLDAILLLKRFASDPHLSQDSAKHVSVERKVTMYHDAGFVGPLHGEKTIHLFARSLFCASGILQMSSLLGLSIALESNKN